MTVKTRPAQRPPQTIAAAWAELEMLAMPLDCDKIQRREMRRAFYAGAQSMLRMLLDNLDPGDAITDADLSRMASWHDELVRFGAMVRDDKD